MPGTRRLRVDDDDPANICTVISNSVLRRGSFERVPRVFGTARRGRSFRFAHGALQSTYGPQKNSRIPARRFTCRFTESTECHTKKKLPPVRLLGTRCPRFDFIRDDSITPPRVFVRRLKQPRTSTNVWTRRRECIISCTKRNEICQYYRLSIIMYL